MLDNSTIDYILSYYSRFMTLKEAAAMKHHITSYKFRDTLSKDASGEKLGFLQEKGWLSNDKEVEELLREGYEQFRVKTAERILKENGGKVYFNDCPKCGKLARTPQAKQCRYCGYSWHRQVVATFQIASAFQVTGRPFFVLGDILTGEIKVGMKADLTILGLAVKPTIKAIEFARHNNNDIVWEDIGLGLVDLTVEDKEFLKSQSPFLTPIFIEDQNVS